MRRLDVRSTWRGRQSRAPPFGTTSGRRLPPKAHREDDTVRKWCAYAYCPPHQLRRPCLPRGNIGALQSPRRDFRGSRGGGSYSVRATHWAFSGFRQKIAGDAREGKGPSFVAKRHCGPRGKRRGAISKLSIIRSERSRIGRHTLKITPPTHPKPPLHHPPPESQSPPSPPEAPVTPQ